jgi:outer membrane protein assembly factor BamB
MKRLFLLPLSILLLLSNLLYASTIEWPDYRGPTGQGISEAKNPPLHWNQEENVSWKVEIPGRGWSSPVLIDGKLMLTSGMEEPVDGMHDLLVLQLDAGTGEVVWQKTVLQGTEVEAADRNAKNSLASPTVVVHEGVVYAHFGHMGTVALKFETGETIWKQKISYTSKNGNGASPVVVDDLLVFTTDSFEEPVVTALHLDTGKIAWRTERSHKVKNNFSHGTPLVINYQGQTQIISPGSVMVGSYRPSDGKEMWIVRYKMGYSMSTRPIFVNDHIYMATGFGRPSFYSIRVDGATGDLTDTHVEWQYHKSMPKTPSPNFVNGTIITLEDAGRLQCLDAETGEHLWMESLKATFSASPVQIGNRLYIMSEEGRCFVIDVDRAGATIVAENDLEEEALATPAIVDDAIYIRSHPHLWKITSGD